MIEPISVFLSPCPGWCTDPHGFEDLSHTVDIASRGEASIVGIQDVEIVDSDLVTRPYEVELFWAGESTLPRLTALDCATVIEMLTAAEHWLATRQYDPVDHRGIEAKPGLSRVRLSPCPEWCTGGHEEFLTHTENVLRRGSASVLGYQEIEIRDQTMVTHPHAAALSWAGNFVLTDLSRADIALLIEMVTAGEKWLDEMASRS